MEEEEKKESGMRSRPQRRGEFNNDSAMCSGPAGQVCPPACMLLGIDCIEKLLLAWPQRQRRVRCELGSSGSSAGQVLPPACTLMSCESPESLARCRLNRRGTLGFEAHGTGCVRVLGGFRKCMTWGNRMINACGFILGKIGICSTLWPRGPGVLGLGKGSCHG